MINEAYISFETAKLLKEKGFDEPLQKVIAEKSCPLSTESVTGIPHYLARNSECSDEFCTCPTQQMAMRWLREEFNIYVNLHTDYHGTQWTIKEKTLSVGKGGFNVTYEAACEDAIKYCLENLI